MTDKKADKRKSSATASKSPGMSTKKMAVPSERKPSAKLEAPAKGNVRVQINPKVRADSATFGGREGKPGDILEIPEALAKTFADWAVDGVKVLIDAPRVATVPPKDTDPDEG